MGAGVLLELPEKEVIHMTSYDVIAKVIKDAIEWSDYQCNDYQEEKYLTMIQATTLVEFFVDAFAKADPTFDKEKFLTAVGYDGLEPPFEKED
jgi:hypothetical protein